MFITTRNGRVHVGGVLDDIVDMFKGLPGGSWVVDAVNSGAGWIGDMAKTTPGQVVLIGISNAMLFPAIAGLEVPSVSNMEFVGPQVASVVWTIPDVAAGKPFVDTYVREVTTRAIAVLAFFTAGLVAAAAGGVAAAAGEAADQLAKDEVTRFTSGISKAINDAGLRDAIDRFKAIYGQQAEDEVRQKLKEQGLDPEALARHYWIRYDSAAEAVHGLLGRSVYDIHGEFPLNNNPPRYLPFEERNKLQPLQANITSTSPTLPGGSYDVRPRGLTDVTLPKGSPGSKLGRKEFLFQTPLNTGNRGPIGQILLLMLLTSPAWAPVLVWRR